MLRKALAGGIQSDKSSPEEPVESVLGHVAQRFEHYELVMDEHGEPLELGRRAMGITYKAIDINLRCPVTLKVISERYLSNGGGAAKILAGSARHPQLGIQVDVVASVFYLEVMQRMCSRLASGLFL